jgi:isoamylase
VPPRLRGTYAGLASYPVIEHLQRLGITAIELMPVHAFVDDRILLEKGLRNYWGYNSVGFFAPEMRYSESGTVGEFKSMVKRFNSAGIEVILDVVYNHTAEGNHLGPTLSFRGIDNTSYYRVIPDNQRYYMDFTGCGNTLNMVNPRMLQMIMDSLRYWAVEMHVDGFRFDLAAALARELYDVNRLSAFFEVVNQDPVLSQVKLIAEPWDLGAGGYQVGNFPPGWTEWNGKYRDSVRAYWKGDGGLIGELGYRLTGSSDLYEKSGRRPYASINFITPHDGFTLRDLVSYNDKHNEANLEENRDGESNNWSWNCGAEGTATDSEILQLRARQTRNLLATLILSQGVPRLVAGDEFGRTQSGNNNAYCQDNELSWVDWRLRQENPHLVDYVQLLIGIRRAHPSFHRRSFFQGRPIRGATVKDITWLAPSGDEMTDDEWSKSFARCLGMFLAGDALGEDDDRGLPLHDADFILFLNAHHEQIDFVIPFLPAPRGWNVVIDTSRSDGGSADQRTFSAGARFPLLGRSLALLIRSKQALRMKEAHGVPESVNKSTPAEQSHDSA